MAASIFADKSRQPDSRELDKALGDASPLLESIESYITDRFCEPQREWKFYGKKAGWTLGLAINGRRALHLIPLAGRFTVVVTLGKKAVAAALDSELPNSVKAVIEGTREYAEGRPIRLDVATATDVATVTELVGIKLSS